MKQPKTLQQAIEFFSDKVNCREYAMAIRWPAAVTCPKCGSANVLFLEKYERWHCREKHAAPQFTLKTGTVMEDSPLPLSKWLPAIWLLSNCKNGISSYELARDLGITQKSAWFMLHRIRAAMQPAGGGKLGGRVEVDETFIGGKARNMHARKRIAKGIGSGGEGKTVVLGILERGGKVRTHVVPNREGKTLQPLVRDAVKRGAKIMSNEHAGYNGLEDDFLRGVVNHAVEYVNGTVHTNGMENYWSLLKRGLNGTYVSVEPFHLFRYLDEQAFRYNYRKHADKKPVSDSERFDAVLSQASGKRLTYSALTGKVGAAEVF